MKNILKDERGSVGWILIMFVIVLFAVGFFGGILQTTFNMIIPETENAYNGTELADNMSTNDTLIKDLLNSIWDNIYLILVAGICLFFYLWSTRQG